MIKEPNFIQRLAIQVEVTWDVIPRYGEVKKWLFDINGYLTVPGEVIGAGRLPVSASRSYPTVDYVNESRKIMFSRVFWAAGNVKFLGFEIAAGVFYRLKRDEERFKWWQEEWKRC